MNDLVRYPQVGVGRGRGPRSQLEKLIAHQIVHLAEHVDGKKRRQVMIGSLLFLNRPVRHRSSAFQVLFIGCKQSANRVTRT